MQPLPDFRATGVEEQADACFERAGRYGDDDVSVGFDTEDEPARPSVDADVDGAELGVGDSEQFCHSGAKVRIKTLTDHCSRGSPSGYCILQMLRELKLHSLVILCSCKHELFTVLSK